MVPTCLRLSDANGFARDIHHLLVISAYHVAMRIFPSPWRSRAAHWIGRRQLDQLARPILKTAPLPQRSNGPIFFSMVGTKSVLPYLVAIKSLQKWMDCGRITLLDDGTLTPLDRDLLSYHCGNPLILDAKAVDTSPAPKGGCWERLLTLLDLRRSEYVVQLDSDTLTLGPLPEVKAAISAGRAFTLGGGPDSAILPVKDASQRARAQLGTKPGHIQTHAEAILDQLEPTAQQAAKYVRGCAAFAGFPVNQAGRAPALSFSRAAERLLGLRWHEWGSEQVASNFLIANEPQAALLPISRYVNYWQQSLGDECFVHFPGTYRYHGGVYPRLLHKVVADLAP